MISKCKKKEEKNKDKKENKKNIISFNRNKPDYMMREKLKRKINTKEKLNSKRKCVIVKLKMNLKEKKLKRKNRTNLIIFLCKKLKKKFLLKNRKWEIGNTKSLTDLNKLWSKIKKMKEDSDKKLKNKDFK